jgi:ABC-type branched-subunit amino acid transport system ATPase component
MTSAVSACSAVKDLYMFRCERLTKNFGGLKSVEGVDLDVSEGEILG